MPKKFGTNTKKEEAREREKNKKKEAKENEERRIENEYWKETDDKVIKKKDKEKEKEQEKQEKLRKKQEAKELLEQEEKDILSHENKYKLKPPTVRQIQQFEEERIKDLLIKDEKKTVVHQDEDFDINEDYINENYAKIDPNNIDVSGIDKALDQFAMEDEDNHPEKRMKQAWELYFESELPRMQSSHPHLKRSQYIQMLQKEFKTSPKNPVYIKQLKDSKKSQDA